MKILFNFTISAAVAIVIVVSSVNAKNVSLNPIADNRSRSGKPSAKQSSSTSFPISHIDVAVKSTTDAIANNTVVVTSSGNITTEMPTSNNINAIVFVEDIAKPTAAYTKITEEITLEKTTTIASVETTTENKTFANQTTTESEDLITRYIINVKLFTQSTKCKSNETEDTNGNCKPLIQ